MAILSFEDAWKSLTELQERLPSHETYSQSLYMVRSSLWEIVNKVIRECCYCALKVGKRS